MDSTVQSLREIFDFRYLYLLIVLSGSSFLLIRGLIKIRLEKRRRLRSAHLTDYTKAVEATDLNIEKEEHPHLDFEHEDTESLTRGRAMESIEARFEFIRKFYVPTIVIVTLLLVCLPFLPTIPATYLSLLTGLAAGLIGLAAKPVIENFIAGVVITLSQPIRINDTVIIDGKYGTIEKITSLYTVLKIWNWRRYVIPNHTLLQKELENLSLSDEDEWAHVAFWVAPDSDLSLVKKLAKEAMQCKYLSDIENPSFWIMDLEKDSIACWVAGWAKDPAQAWALKSTTRTNLVTSLQKHDVSFQMGKSSVQLQSQTLKAFQGLRTKPPADDSGAT